MKVFKKLINVLEAILLVIIVAGIAMFLAYKGWNAAVAYGRNGWKFIWRNVTAFPYDTLHLWAAIVGVILLVVVIALIVLSIKKKQAHFYSPLSYVAMALMVVVAYHKRRGLMNAFSSGNALKVVIVLAYIILFVLIAIYALVTTAAILCGPNNSKKAPAAIEEKTEEPAEEPAEEEKTTEEPVEETPAEEPTEEETPAEEETPVEETPVEEEKAEEKAEEPAEEPAEEETPAEEPAEEEKAEEPVAEESAVVEPIVETTEEATVEATETTGEVYKAKKFSDKMLALDPEVLKMYSDIKNEFLSYRKVRSRLSKSNDSFRYSGNLVAKICVSGKGLKLYLALDPLSVDSAIYHQRDASSKKKFAATPLVVRVKSPLSFRKAMKLVALACETAGTTKKSRYTPDDFTTPDALKTKKELKAEQEAAAAEAAATEAEATEPTTPEAE